MTEPDKKDIIGNDALSTFYSDIVDKPVENSLQNKICSALRSLTIEPVLLLSYISLSLLGGTIQNLVMRKYCLINMNLPRNVCLNLENNHTLEDEVQEFTSNLITYKTILDTLPTVLWTLVIGPWSDKNGRLLLLIMPNVGIFLEMVVLIVNSYFETELGVNYVLFCSVPFALSGGLVCLLTGGFSYIADITNDNNRTLRFSITQASTLLGNPIGAILAGLLYKYFDFIVVFSVAASLNVLAILYIIIFVKETVKSSNNLRDKFRTIIDCKQIKEGVTSLCLKRKNHGRLQIFLLLGITAINFLPLFGEINTIYLYGRWKFQWDLTIYSYYIVSFNLSNSLGLLVVLPILSSVFKIRDTTLGVISTILKIILELSIALSTHSWMVFAASFFLIFSGMIPALTRIIISKIVSHEEHGKMQSVINAAESAVPTLGVLMFTYLYNATRNSFPSAIFYMSASLAVIPAIFMLWICILRRKLSSSSSELHIVEAPN